MAVRRLLGLALRRHVVADCAANNRSGDTVMLTGCSSTYGAANEMALRRS